MADFSECLLYNMKDKKNQNLGITPDMDSNAHAKQKTIFVHVY